MKDGQAENAPSGVIRGYDAVTGELAWAWDMCKPELKGVPAEGETYTRGTPNMWTIAAGDSALGLVYLPMGNSSVDYWGGDRAACENEYSTALVALDQRARRRSIAPVHGELEVAEAAARHRRPAGACGGGGALAAVRAGNRRVDGLVERRPVVVIERAAFGERVDARAVERLAQHVVADAGGARLVHQEAAERHGALPRGLALAARNLQKGVERQPAAAVGGDPARPERRELRLELGGVRGYRDASEFALVVQVAGHRFGAEAQLEPRVRRAAHRPRARHP